MANTSPLAGLLDRASNIFGLARDLGWEFQQDFREQSPVNIVGPGDQTARQRHRDKINEFIAAVQDIREATKNPPEGFVGVADVLRRAAETARLMATSPQWDPYDSWPYLNQHAQDGYEAVKAARATLEAADDPWDFSEAPAAPAFSLLDRFPATPAGHVAFLEWVRDEVHCVAEAKRQQLERGYSNATIESMVRGIKWPEAGQRLSVLGGLPADVVEQVARVLRRELTIGTVERIDELLTPAVRMLRDAWEGRDLSPLDQADGQNFIAQLLAGRDDVELNPRELALLEAHLQQPVSLAQLQCEAQAGTRETATGRNKLKLIRDFNRNLRAIDEVSDNAELSAVSQQAADVVDNPAEMSKTVEPKRSRRGRRKADYKTVQSEEKLASDWARARDAGTYKPDFANQNSMTAKEFDALLDRVAKRNRLSE